MERSKKKKIFIWIAVAFAVIAVLAFVLPMIFGGEEENPYFEISQEFTVTSDNHTHFFQHWRIEGTINNKTDQPLDVTVRIEYNNVFDGQQFHTVNITITPNNSVEVQEFVRHMHNTINEITVSANNRSMVVYTGGFDIFGFIFILPFLLFFIFIFIAVFTKVGVSFSVLSGRMTDIDGRIATCNDTAELERLRAEKEILQQQMNQFVECEFCRTRNNKMQTGRCTGCGAPV